MNQVCHNTRTQHKNIKKQKEKKNHEVNGKELGKEDGGDGLGRGEHLFPGIVFKLDLRNEAANKYDVHGKKKGA